MAFYSPEPLPINVGSPELSEYLWREFLRIAAAVERASAITFDITIEAPQRPQVGQVIYADGTVYDPGSGEGLYVYDSTGTWVKLLT